jgi:hypothetical protein
VQNIYGFWLGKMSKRQHKKAPSKHLGRPRRYRYGVRTENSPIVLQAFSACNVEAMNFSSIGHAEYAAALGPSPHSVRIWRDRLEQSDNEMDCDPCFIQAPGHNKSAQLIARAVSLA